MADSDSRAFDAFYQETSRRLLAQLYASCGNLSEAQDSLQEAYMRAWQHWAQLSTYDDPEAWVRTVAWRVAVNRWHRARSAVRARTRLGRQDDVAGPGPDSVALVAALRRLPRVQREAVVLHHVAGLAVADIAAALGVPEGTVKARLARGRATLAPLLSTEVDDAR